MIGMMNAGQESEFFRENQRPLEISSDGKPVYDVPLFNTQPRKKYSEHIIALLKIPLEINILSHFRLFDRWLVCIFGIVINYREI